MRELDLNAEAGESYGLWPGGDDAGVMPHLTSVSIACGYHAGDHNAMLRTLELAAAAGVAVGAHCGHHDLLGFGYRSIPLSQREIRALVLYQVGALEALARTVGLRLHHVKPHGALYMQGLVDAAVAGPIVEAIAAYDSSLLLYSSPECEFLPAAERAGVRTVIEHFIDRPIHADGTLVYEWAEVFDPSPDVVAARFRQLVEQGTVPAVEGGEVAVAAGCLAIHTTTPGAAEIAVRLREEMRSAGVTAAAP